MFCAGTTAPLPSAAVSTRTLAVEPAVILNPTLVAAVRPALDAINVYPVPDLSIERLPNVATPATAATVEVPVSVPPPGFVPIAIVTGAMLGVRFPKVSRILTVTAGVMEEPEVVFEGCVPNASFAAAAVVMLNG